MNQNNGNQFNPKAMNNNSTGPQVASTNKNVNPNPSNPMNAPESAITNAHRTRANEGLVRANANKGNTKSGLQKPAERNGGSNLPNGKSNTPNQSVQNNSVKQQQKLQQGVQNAKQYAKQKAAEQAVKKMALAAGVPEPVTDKALKTKKGQQMLQSLIDAKKNKGNVPKALLKNAASAMPGIPGLIGKAANALDKKSDNESEDKEKELKEQNEAASGDINFEIDKKTLKRIVIFAPVAVFILSFFVILMAMISNDFVSGVIVGEMSSKGDQQEIKDGHKQVKDDMGEVEIDTSDFSESGNGRGTATKTGYGGSYKDFPAEYQERFRNLGNAFSSELECKNEKCYERPEFKYYVKIADIATRYRNKYNLSLDWYLITATNLYFSDTQEERMTKNLGGYNENDVKNTSSTISLDWDYDYKNISGYQYLDASNSQYDLQILAKNMVKKKTTQTCTDSNGNMKTQEDEDLEDFHFQSGGDKRLECSGSYNIESTYTVDKEKYKEFMLEYIDKKMQSQGSGNSGSNNPSNNCTVSSNKYIWPIGSRDTSTGSDGKTYALDKPEVVDITSYFSSQESFRTQGHGAIDISSGGNGPGVVNVIAAKDGKVVYPTNKSQTSYSDNGYIGNNDGYGYGNYVIIQHDDGLYTLYGHLAKDSIKVMAGDTVKQGQVIAKLGHSGNSNGPHLHFEMRKGANSSNNRVDPLGYVDPKDPRLGVSKTSCSGVDGFGSAVVSLAVSQQNDPQAVNGEKYWKYLGFSSRIEWCACFVSWVLNNVEYNGQKLTKINFKSASVAQWMNYFYQTDGLEFKYNDNCSKFKGKNGSGTYTPKPGDVIFFDWNNSFNGTMPVSFEDHIGLVQKVENGKIITIEGNASNSVRSNTFPLNSCNVIGFGSYY